MPRLLIGHNQQRPEEITDWCHKHCDVRLKFQKETILLFLLVNILIYINNNLDNFILKYFI